jgi:Uma2 family endonuclease
MTVATGANPVTRTPRQRYAVPSDPIFRLSVEQYHAMIKSGILTSADRVELVEGWLIPKMSQNPPHSVAAELAAEKIRMLGLNGWCIRSEKPISLDDSEPEPDVAIARGSIRDYIGRHPSSMQLGLVIEVSDTTLDQDRGVKQRVYARAGIPFYWIINLAQRQIEVYAHPSGLTDHPAYANRHVHGPDAEVPIILDGRHVASIVAADLLP